MKNSFLVLLMLVALGIKAQSYKHFTIENGLPSNQIYKILQDNDGFIWIATDKGITKFNGKHFKTFSTANGLPVNDIWNMIVTNDQKVWYFSKANALGYIFKDSIYKFYAKNKATVFYPNIINRYQNEVGFVSYGKNYALYNNQWKGISSTAGKYSDKIHPKLQKKLKEKNNSDSPMNYNVLKRYGRLFAQQINDSLFCCYYNNKTLSFININTGKKQIIKNDYLFSNFVSAVSTNSEIQISGNGFFAKLDKNYQLSEIQLFDKKLQANRIFQDKDGNYWVSSSNKGVYYIPKNHIDTQIFFMDEPVRFIKVVNGKLYAVINYKGVYQYDIKQQKFVLKLPVKDHFYGMSYKDKNTDLAFTRTKTYLLQKGKLDSIPLGIKSLIACNGSYYSKGVYKIYKLDSNLKKVDSISLDNVSSMINFKGQLIVANTLGLYKIVNNKPVRILQDYLEDTSVLSLEHIDNTLIMGTDGKGVFTWDGTTFKSLPNTQNTMINNIFVQGNNIIVSGQNGVLTYLYNADNQLVYNSIIRKYDGLISNQINRSVIFDNKLFSASSNGISAMPMQREHTNLWSKIYLTSATYSNKQYNTLPDSYLYQNNNYLNLHYGIIDFKGQENHEVYYRLLPTQTDWLPIKTEQITFYNLQPKKYSFQIKVVTPYKHHITQQYNFSIKPLWWQTLLARLLFIVTGISLFLFIGYYFNKKKTQKKEENFLLQKQMAEHELYALRSQMNPHFVFNSLNAIMYYINEENFDQSEKYLIEFSRLIRMIFGFSREETISLNDEIKLLQTYLKLEKMRFGTDFNYCFEIDEHLNTNKNVLPTMLLQPIVENAVNHGIFHNDGVGNICVKIERIKPEIIQIQISDDGIGLEKSKEINRKTLKKHLSKSTMILQERIALLNKSGDWEITYCLTDLTKKTGKYNTEVTLKIKKI